MDFDLITRVAALIAVLGTAVGLRHRRVLRDRAATGHGVGRRQCPGRGHGSRAPIRRPANARARGARGCRYRDERGAGCGGRTLGAGDRGGRRPGPAVGLARALHPGERTHQPTTDRGCRRRQALPNGRALQAKWDRIIGARAMLQGLGSGRPVRGADGLTRPHPHPHQPNHRRRTASMFQLRIYTLRSPEALQRYATVHWARHLATFTTFGVTTHGVWTERSGGANRLVALIRYPPGADPEQLTRADHDQPGIRRRHGRLRTSPRSSTFSRYCLTRHHSHRSTDEPQECST